MKYSFESRIRYSETDKDSFLTFPAMMDYFQDTSTFHGEDNGLSIKFLASKDLTWVLSGWQVRIFALPKLDDYVRFSTWAYAFKGCVGLRNYSLSDLDGNLCAAADTQYVLMDTKKQLQERIPNYLVEGYGLEPDSHLDLGLSRKIAAAGEEELLEPLVVREYMIDTNKHVNNSQYIKTAMSFIPRDMEFNCFRAEYKKQAHLGDVLYPSRSYSENTVQMRFYDSDGKPYFIAEWAFDAQSSGGDYA